jgi:L,D-transpeptidase YcbB
MRKNGSNLALVGLLAGVSIAVTPNYATADVDDFIQELLDAPPLNATQRVGTQSEFAAPVKRKPGHLDTVRANALLPEPFVMLRQKNLKPAEQMDALATAVHVNLNRSENAPVRVRALHRKPIVRFYEDNGFAPVWIGNEGLNDKAKRLLVLLSKAEEEGLRSLDYLPASLSDFSDNGDSLNTSPSNLARLEIELTAVALEYSHQASAGRVKPIRISDLHGIQAKPADPAEVLVKLKETDKPDSYLASLQPLMPQYQYLKTALAKYRKKSSASETIYIPGGRLIRAGGRDDRLTLVARRLEQLGFYDVPIEQSAEESTFYGPKLVAAVKDLQEQSGLRSEGIIGRKTLAALNGQSSEEKITKIVLSMERLRWLPQDLKSRYVFVNQAFFETWMMDDGKEIYRSDVIVGLAKFQTAVFADEMEKVTLNPNWYVPRSIIYEDMIPKLLANPYYLQQQGYDVLDGSGRVVDSSTIDWGRFETRKSITYTVRQPPGPKNALGKVKFMFPNKFSIYMHDTPARNLFKKKVRAFSHGCVRLQKPMEFANIILGTVGWSPEKIRAAVDTGENQTIFLKKKIPVYLGYYTAWADAEGNVKTRNDVYGRDRVLSQAFEQNIRARDSRKIASR